MSRLWILLPQAFSRLASFVTFAVIANSESVDTLGIFTVAVAIVGAAPALAPAIVGKPLALWRESSKDLGEWSHSAAILGILPIATALAVAANFVSEAVAVALYCAAIGLPSAMAVECGFWRISFARGPRAAAIYLGSAYLFQIVVVLLAALAGFRGSLLLLSVFLPLAIYAIGFLWICGPIGFRSGLVWIRQWLRWWPFVLATATGMVASIATPILIAGLTGLKGAAVYRAGELLFGLANLAIGATTQSLLANPGSAVRRSFFGGAAVCVVVSISSGVFFWIIPLRVLELVVGPIAATVVGLMFLLTLHRSSLGVASVANTLLVSKLRPVVYGRVTVVLALIPLVSLVLWGLQGSVSSAALGLALGEALAAAIYIGIFSRRSYGNL